MVLCCVEIRVGYSAAVVTSLALKERPADVGSLKGVSIVLVLLHSCRTTSGVARETGVDGAKGVVSYRCRLNRGGDNSEFIHHISFENKTLWFQQRT